MDLKNSKRGSLGVRTPKIRIGFCCTLYFNSKKEPPK